MTKKSGNEQLAHWFAQCAPWWMVGVLLLFYVLSIMDRLVINMLVVPIQNELRLSDFQMSLLMGPAFSICFGLAGYPLGWLADRFSRRGVIYGSITVWSLASVGTALAVTFPLLFLSRIGVGVGEAALTPAAYTLIADRFPRKRLATAMAVFGMGSKIGTAVAFAVGGWVLAYSSHFGGVSLPVFGSLSSWRLAILIIGLPGVVFALMSFSFAEPARYGRSVAVHSTTGIWTYMGSNKPLFVTLIAGFAFAAVAAAGLVSWVPTYITREFGMPPKVYAPIMGVINLVSASTIVLKGFVIDRLYARGVRDAHVRFYTWMLAVSLPVTVLAFSVHNAYWFMAVYAIVDVVLVSFLIYMGATIQLMVPEAIRNRVTAIFMFIVMTIAAGVAPTLVASLTDFVFHSGAALGKSLMLVTACFSALSLIMLRIALRHLVPAIDAAGRSSQSVLAAG